MPPWSTSFIERLRAEKLLDDRRYVENFVGVSRRAAARDPCGCARICANLGLPGAEIGASARRLSGLARAAQAGAAKEVWNSAADRLR